MADEFDELMSLARQLGGNAADAFWDSHERKPTRGDAGSEGWAESAWDMAVKELRDYRMADIHFDECMESWRAGFFGD